MQKQDNFENTIVLGIIFFSDKKYMKISTEIWNFQKKKSTQHKKAYRMSKKTFKLLIFVQRKNWKVLGYEQKLRILDLLNAHLHKDVSTKISELWTNLSLLLVSFSQEGDTDTWNKFHLKERDNIWENSYKDK